MKYFFCLSLCLVLLQPSLVSAITFVEYPTYDDLVTLDTQSANTWYIGELNRFPHTYQFTLAEPQTVSFAILVPELDTPEMKPGGIIVRQLTEGGVAEVTRLNPKEVEWQVWEDSTTGDAYLRGPSYRSELEPGSYLIEVQAPSNQGKYALQFGEGSPTAGIGYFAAVGSLPALKRWHGKSVLHIFESRQVYIPLLVIIVLGSSWWYYRRQHYA
jgi:hypothetical protein